MNRRQFLLLTTGATLGAALGTNALLKASEGNSNTAVHRLYSATDNPDGGHFLSALDLQSGELQSRAVPVRGHAVMPMSAHQALMFGRRPAYECALVDFSQQEDYLQRIQATAGRHFAGHGCLNNAGDTLFTTENDFDGKRGVLGLRDSKTLAHLGEYDTYGLDPHDVRLMPDGKTLVVANGGIETHPDFGRRKLNLKTMQPSLVYIDAANGKKLDEYHLADHQLSIRHLLVNAQGDVGVALQYEGNLYRQQPESLVAWQTHGGELELLQISQQDIPAFSGYMADLAFDPHNQVLAVTSPRGNHVTFWDIASREFLHAVALPEPSGIAFLSQQQAFLVSDATGSLHTIKSTNGPVTASQLHKFTNTIWDNHMVVT